MNSDQYWVEWWIKGDEGEKDWQRERENEREGETYKEHLRLTNALEPSE